MKRLTFAHFASAGLGIVAGALETADAMLRRQIGPRRGPSAEPSSAVQAEAAAAAQMRDHIIASASHDLKTPLASIRLLTHLIKRDAARGLVDARQLGQRVDLIEANVAKMSSLIAELLDVARLQGGKRIQLQLAPTDLVAMARRIADNHELAGGADRVVVDAAVPELVGAWDAGRLERVLGNLVGNSLKYSDEASEVKIHLFQQERAGRIEAVVEVQDSGVGIPAEDLPHIFDWFHRAGNVAGVAGTGVGLASAKLIVERHGGTIEVRSRFGKGTTVTVRLPLSAAAALPDVVQPEFVSPEAVGQPSADRE